MTTLGRYAAEALEMMRESNPLLLQKLTEEGKLRQFLADLQDEAETIWAQQYQKVLAKEPPATSSYEDQVEATGRAMAAARQLVRETLIRPLGQPSNL